MNAITLAVLAGGEGSRMGRPKGDLRISGVPILRYLLDKWNWTGPTLLVTAPSRERPAGSESFDREVTDPVAGEGPLRGIITTLENASDAQAVIITTCDMPLVTRDMLDHITQMLLTDPEALGVMTRHNQEIEPFPLTIRPQALGALQQRLKDSARSVRSLANLPDFRVIDAPVQWTSDVWTNLNSPDDYRRFIATIEKP